MDEADFEICGGDSTQSWYRGALAIYVYTTNGLYDPNTTGIGHQPTGFDQLMALYNEYVVIGSTIKVSFTNSDETNAAICGISMLDYSTTDNDWKKYVENGNTTWTGLSRCLGAKMLRLSHTLQI